MLTNAPFFGLEELRLGDSQIYYHPVDIFSDGRLEVGSISRPSLWSLSSTTSVTIPVNSQFTVRNPGHDYRIDVAGEPTDDRRFLIIVNAGGLETAYGTVCIHDAVASSCFPPR